MIGTTVRSGLVPLAALLLAFVFLSGVHAGQVNSRVRAGLKNQDVLASTANDFMSLAQALGGEAKDASSPSMSLYSLVSKVISSTSLKGVIGVQEPHSIVVPLLGVIRLPDETVHLQKTISTSVQLAGVSVGLSLSLDTNEGFRMAMKLSSALPGQTLSSALGVALGSGNNAFLTKVLDALPLENSEVAIESSCSVHDLLKDGIKAECNPTLSIAGGGELSSTEGDLPALGKIQYRVTLSRQNGLSLSISAPELNQKNIELVPSVASIQIGADSIQITIGSDLISAFLDRVLQTAQVGKLSHALVESGAVSQDRNRIRDVFAQAWSSQNQTEGIKIQIKGSVAIKLMDLEASADVHLSFDSGSGSISFSAIIKKHPVLEIAGVSIKLNKIEVSSKDRKLSIDGDMNLFGMNLACSAEIEKDESKSFKVKAYVRLLEGHGDWNLESLLKTKLPGVLKTIRIEKFVGEVDFSSSGVEIIAEVFGQVIDSVDFKLYMRLSKAKGKNPSFHARFQPTLKKHLPIFELLPSLTSMSILNEIKFVSFALPTFNVTSQGNIAIELSSVISLWGSHIAFEGSYSGEEKTFSFSAKSVEDTKPILLASVIPAFSSIPIAKDVSLDSFSISVDKLAKFPTPKFEIEAVGSVRSFRTKVHTVFGGDSGSPSFSIETKKMNSTVFEDGAKAISFLDGLPVKGFSLQRLSASLLQGTVTFSIEGGLAHGLLQYSGKLVIDTKTKSGTLDAEISSPQPEGAPISNLISSLKNVPFLDKIAIVSATLSIHREKGEGVTGSLNMKTRMWSIPVEFAASLSSDRITFSVSSNAGAEEGIPLSNHIPEISRIEGLKSLKLNSFLLQADKELKADGFTASLTGKGEIFDVNADFKLEYLPKGLHATFDAKSKDSAGVKLSSHLPWLENIPVVKDIRFISAHLVAELTKEPSGRYLFITAKGALMSVEVSVSATLSSETKSITISAKPADNREQVPLSEFIPLKGVIADILGQVKLIEFSFTASLAGKSSDAESVKSRLQVSLNCDLKLFGADFSGSFQYARGTPSFSLALGRKDSNADLKLSQISPSLKSFTEFLGDIVIKNAKVSYGDRLFELRGEAAVLGVDVALRLDIDLDKNIFFSASATSSRGVITLASLVPSLKDNQIFKSFGVQEVKISLNKTGSSTTFSIEGTALLFNVPVSASFTIGTGGRVILKVFTPPGHVVTLKSIVPQVEGVPVLNTLGLKDLLVKFSKESSKDSPKVTIGGAVTILGISLRIDVIISSKGITVAGLADFSAMKDAQGFLGIVASVCHKVGVVVTTYTHRSPLLNNEELPKGAVAVYGEVNPVGAFKKITEIVDKITGKSGGVSGLRFTGIISPDITKCSFSIEMPGINFSLGKQGSSIGASVILQFKGLGPTFALKFKLSIKLDKADIALVAAISIRLPSFITLSASMVGRWSEPFGLKNTFIENLAVSAGIKIPKGPYPPIPSEFGFMGTVFVSPIHFSIAIAVALDGGVLVSGSLNVLSIQALLGVGRTLGIPIPQSADNNLPTLTLHDLRIFICSRPMSIGEFSFTPGLSFSAGVKIMNFAGYVSFSVSETGIELFGAMSRVQLGPLVIDRPEHVKIPPEVSRLGPATQALPKEINSIDEVKKVSAMLSLAQLDDKECRSRKIHKHCVAARSVFSESMLSSIYNGPVVAASLTKSSQILFFTGRIRLFNNVIQIHCHLSLKKFEFKFHLRLFNILAIDFEAGADIATLSNIRVKADIRVRDLRHEILGFMERLFGLQKSQKHENMNNKARQDAEAARRNAESSARARYEACARQRKSNDASCVSVLTYVEKYPILAEVIGERVQILHEQKNLPSEMVAYRDALSQVYFQHLNQFTKGVAKRPQLFAQVYSKARWAWFRRHIIQPVYRHVIRPIINFIVQITTAAWNAIKAIAERAARAIVDAFNKAWEALKRGLFSLVKALLDTFHLNRAWFNADIGSLTNPGTISGGVSVRVRERHFDWSFHLNLKDPLGIIKTLGNMIWNAVRQIARWF